MYSPYLKVGQGTVSFVTANSCGANDPKVGDRCIDGNEEYIFVCNVGADAQISVGRGCVLSGVSGYSVTVSSTSSADILVGVVKHNTIATGGYGWVVTRGFTRVQLHADVSMVSGSLLELSADGKFAIRSNTTANNNWIGKSMEAAASNTSGMVYLSCF